MKRRRVPLRGLRDGQDRSGKVDPAPRSILLDAGRLIRRRLGLFGSLVAPRCVNFFSARVRRTSGAGTLGGYWERVVLVPVLLGACSRADPGFAEARRRRGPGPAAVVRDLIPDACGRRRRLPAPFRQSCDSPKARQVPSRRWRSSRRSGWSRRSVPASRGRSVSGVRRSCRGGGVHAAFSTRIVPLLFSWTPPSPGNATSAEAKVRIAKNTAPVTRRGRFTKKRQSFHLLNFFLGLGQQTQISSTSKGTALNVHRMSIS